MKNTLYIIISLFFLTSCSVKYSLNGKMPPDFSKIVVGTSMSEINGLLGRPQKVRVLENGNRLHVYRYRKGNDSSYVNAALNSLMFIGTAGIWETLQPWESNMDHVNITYDESDKAATINRYVRIAENIDNQHFEILN